MNTSTNRLGRRSVDWLDDSSETSCCCAMCCAIDFAYIGRLTPKFGVVGTFANQSFNPMLIMPKKNNINYMSLNNILKNKCTHAKSLYEICN